MKTKKSQMWTSRKNNCKDSLYQKHQECKGKKTEIGSIHCTRSNKIAHRKCQCLTESLRPLLPFSLLLCSGGVRYTSHLVPPLWLEKHTLSSPYSLATVDVQVSTFNLSSLTSYGWAEELIQTYPSVPALGVTLRVRQSPQRSQFGFMTSGTNQTRTLWLYLGPPIICEPSRQILDWLLFLHSLKLVRSVNMCSGGTSDYDVTRGALHSLAQATGQSSWTGCLDCSLSPSSKNNFPLRFHPSFPTAPSKQNTPMAGLQTQRTDSRTSSPVSQTRIYTYTHVCVGVREWTVIAAVWGLVRHGSWQ